MQRSLLIFENSIKSEITRKEYRYYLDKFISYCKIKDHNSLASMKLEELQIMTEDYVMDLKKRVNPNSVPTYLYAIQAFFESNDIELRWKKIRRLYPARIKISGNKPYTNEQVKKILEFATSLRNKAIIHFLASSGVRVGALSDLKLSNIKLCFLIPLYMFTLKTNQTANFDSSLVLMNYQSSNCISLL